MPEVDIVMPARNASATIGATCHSLLKQSCRDWRLILVDDGSSDGTAECAAGIVGKRLLVIRNDAALGVARSLNRALDKADARYVARLDADDLAREDRLARQVSALAEGPYNAAASWYQYIDAGGRPLRTPKAPARIGVEGMRRVLLLGNPICHPSVMFKWPAVDDLRYPEGQHYEDYGLWLAANQRLSWLLDSRPLISWRLHPSNQSMTRIQQGMDSLTPLLQAAVGRAGLSQRLAERTLRVLLWPDEATPAELSEATRTRQLLMVHVTNSGDAEAARLADRYLTAWQLRALRESTGRGGGLRSALAVGAATNVIPIAASVAGAAIRQLQR